MGRVEPLDAVLVLTNPEGTQDSQFSGISGRQRERVFAAYHSGRALTGQRMG